MKKFRQQPKENDLKKLQAPVIYPIVISILFGSLFWIMDGVIYFYYFSDFIRLLIVEGPETLMESIILKVPAHALIVRSSFLAMSLVGGLMSASYLLSLKKSRRELTLAEDALQESAGKFRNIVETIGDWVWEIDEKGRYSYASPVAKQLLGYEPAEVIGKTPFDLMPDDEAAAVRKDFLKYFDTKVPFKALVHTNQHKDGRFVILETSGQPVFDNQSAFVGYRGVDRDITKRRQAEVALQQAHEQLERRVQERTAQLKATNKELKDFAYIVSHDLKAPLRAISHLTHWISTDYSKAFDPDGKKMMGLVINRVKRMDGLIDGILSYSRIGVVKEKEERLDLNLLVREVIQNLAPHDNVKIIIENRLPVVMKNPIPMGQIFQNLIGNSIRFMDKPEGIVRVGCEDEGTHWKLSVSDNGPGIDRQYHDKIFQIFQTLAPRDDHESTGIGLTLVKKIIELYGGSIRVESEIGHGSKFFFSLPKEGKKDEKRQVHSSG